MHMITCIVAARRGSIGKKKSMQSHFLNYYFYSKLTYYVQQQPSLVDKYDQARREGGVGGLATRAPPSARNL